MKNFHITIVVLVTGLSLALAGCSGTLPATSTSSNASGATTLPTQVTSSGEGPATDAPPSPEASAIPITATCSEILDTEALHKTGSPFVLTTMPPIATGTILNDVLASGGITCAWINSSSGATLLMAAAHLGAGQLALAKAHAASTSPLISLAGTSAGASGYFSAADGVGEVQLVTDQFWIVMESQDFLSAQDSVAFMSMAESALIFFESK
jgi:hypothetical protein